MAGIVVGTNSWLTESDANDYMDDRVLSGEYWTDGASDNRPALITAYNLLKNGGKYDIGAITTDQKVKDAQCEYALFLLQHEPDLDLRMGIQSQGVVVAGIVKERYDRNGMTGIPIPPIVISLLEDYRTDKRFFIFDIERDEEQTTNYNAPGNLSRDT